MTCPTLWNTELLPSLLLLNKRTPAAAPAVENIPAEPAQSEQNLTDDRAKRDDKLRSILKSPKPLPPERRIDMNPEPIETDYSEVDAEEEQDLRRRGDKAFLTVSFQDFMFFFEAQTLEI